MVAGVVEHIVVERSERHSSAVARGGSASPPSPRRGDPRQGLAEGGMGMFALLAQARGMVLRLGAPTDAAGPALSLEQR